MCVCVILDMYNNNTQIHIVKTRITHNGGSEELSRRKQTNKKIKKGQKDVWHGRSMRCEAQHTTQFPPQAHAASGDVQKNGKRYHHRSRACLPGVQKVKSSSTGSVYDKLEKNTNTHRYST